MATKTVKKETTKAVPAKKPAAKKAVVKQPSAPPAPWMPAIGEKVLHNGNIIALTSYEPLEAQIFKRVGQVQTQNPYHLESLDGIEPISRQAVFERIS